MAEPQGDLVQRVRYGIGLIRSDAEEWHGHWRADMQLKVCADMDIVLSELEQLRKENEKLRNAISNFVDLSWLEGGEDG